MAVRCPGASSRLPAHALRFFAVRLGGGRIGTGRALGPIGRRSRAGLIRRGVLGGKPLERLAHLEVGLEQQLDPLPQARVAGARLHEVGCPLGRVGSLKGFDEEIAFTHRGLPLGRARFESSLNAPFGSGLCNSFLVGREKQTVPNTDQSDQRVPCVAQPGRSLRYSGLRSAGRRTKPTRRASFDVALFLTEFTQRPGIPWGSCYG